MRGPVLASVLLVVVMTLAGKPVQAETGHWVAAWGKAFTGGSATGGPSNATVRNIARLTLGGTAVRIRLTNTSVTPLVVGAAYVGIQQGGGVPPSPAVVTGTSRQITFNGGQTSVTVPPKTDHLYSDAVTFTVAAQQNVAVSLYLPSAVNPGAGTAGRNTSFQTPSGTGDRASDESGALFAQPLANTTYALTAIDVLTTEADGAVVGFGSSTFHGSNATPDGYDDVLTQLAVRVNTLPLGAQKGIVNAGIGGDSLHNGLASRLDRDVLSHTGITGVIVYNINDIVQGRTALQIEQDYLALIRIAHARGIQVFCPTWPPRNTTAAQTAVRHELNAWIMNSGACDGTVDWDAVLRFEAGDPDQYHPDYFSDGTHPNPVGHKALADSAPLGWFTQPWPFGPRPATPLAPRPTATWIAAWGKPFTGSASLAVGASPSASSVRNIARMSIGGTALRVRVANTSAAPLTIGSAYVGVQQTGAQVVPGTSRRITWNGGQTTVTVPPRTNYLYSDAVTFTVSAQQTLAVSVFLPNASNPSAATATWSNSYATPTGTGDQTADEGGALYTEVLANTGYAVSAIDVLTTEADGTVVALGSSTFHGFNSVPDGYGDVLTLLSKRVNTLPAGSQKGLVNAGIGGDSLHAALASRLDRDVLSQSGLYGVIVYDINDIANGRTAAQVEEDYMILEGILHSRGVKMFCPTWPPRTATNAAERHVLNAWLVNSGVCDGIVDWEAVLRYEAVDPEEYHQDYRSDGIHPNPVGHIALADSVPLGWFTQPWPFGLSGDTTAPVINAVTASPATLWGPNHQLVSVSVTASVSDDRDGAPTSRIVAVTSSEPESGLWDGDIGPDWVITGDTTVQLRAERSGSGSGRVYTVVIEARDSAGNTSTATTTVLVPHDMK